MIKFILILFSKMPLRLNHFVGKVIGLVTYSLNTRSQSVVRRNIELCFPEMSKSEQQILVKKSLIEIGKGLIESGFIWCNSFEHNAKYITKINGIEHLSSEQKTILLVPHFGCWEITGRVISLKKPVTFMYKELKNKKQNDLLLSLREQQNLTMVAANKRGVLKLQRALKKGQLIAILPDQRPSSKGGVLAPFFGHEVITMTLLVKLVRKNNARVIMTWARRLSKGQGYELNFKPVDVLSKSTLLKDDVAKMNQAIEQLIRTKPEQYLWNYKRFKDVTSYNNTSNTIM